jgi:hypothetical protein
MTAPIHPKPILYKQETFYSILLLRSSGSLIKIQTEGKLDKNILKEYDDM